MIIAIRQLGRPNRSLTFYAGEKEGNWLLAPDGTFSLYIRAYRGKEQILDGSWQPPKIEAVA